MLPLDTRSRRSVFGDVRGMLHRMHRERGRVLQSVRVLALFLVLFSVTDCGSPLS